MRPDDLYLPPPGAANARPVLFRDRRISEESIATELCDGPLLEDQTSPIIQGADTELDVSDDRISQAEGRDALIERLKEQQKANFRATEAYITVQDLLNNQHNRNLDGDASRRKDGSEQHETLPNPAVAGLEIRRPRSALHSGDFSRSEIAQGPHQPTQQPSASSLMSTSPPRPNVFSALSAAARSRPSIGLALHRRSPLSTSPSHDQTRMPSSQSASPKYVLKPPTSPLVREASDSEFDFGSPTTPDRSLRSNRRHTLTPVTSSSHQNDYSQLTAAARAPGSLRREGTYPLPTNGHRVRRSIGASWNPVTGGFSSTPPSLRSRAPSFSSDASPRQSAMVGSYEESILRGRMSGAPSHPLTFEVGIGALGKPGCKPMMPGHVRVDFPAVFYSWTNGQGRVGSVNQEPSPYVGRIDLESNLSPPRPRKERRERPTDDAEQTVSRVIRKRKHPEDDPERRLYRDTKEEINIGGAYRVPRKGSLQLIIKNPNKTAVKVFIVPYDLEGMQPRQRTWIRQRLYSAGPIVEKPISSKTTGEVNSRNRPDLGNGKSTLRYLVHFKICCIGKDRFYLYDEIRVVFANRVPDNKEKLRSEIMMPESPKFMAFRTAPQPTPQANTTSPLPSLLNTEERAVRRRSHGITPSSATFDAEFAASMSQPVVGSPFPAWDPRTPPTPVPPMPVDYSYKTREVNMVDVDTEDSDSAYVLSPNREAWRKTLDETLSSPDGSTNGPYMREGVYGHQPDKSDDRQIRSREDPFMKLTRDDARFGGYFGRSGTPEPGEGIIARRLRSLEMDVDGETDKET